MKRNMLLEEPTNDFSLRLDLIDHFPELFQKNDQKHKIIMDPLKSSKKYDAI